MNTEDLLKKVHRIEIKAKRLSQNVFAGQYHSAFKGKGMTFSEVREYTYGDDIRNIDWNVTARNNHPYVKIFEEERELTVVLMIDVSGSTLFGSENNLKSEVITEIAAVLAFSAVNNNDKVGAILFTVSTISSVSFLILELISCDKFLISFLKFPNSIFIYLFLIAS